MMKRHARSVAAVPQQQRHRGYTPSPSAGPLQQKLHFPAGPSWSYTRRNSHTPPRGRRLARPPRPLQRAVACVLPPPPHRWASPTRTLRLGGRRAPRSPPGPPPMTPSACYSQRVGSSEAARRGHDKRQQAGACLFSREAPSLARAHARTKTTSPSAPPAPQIPRRENPPARSLHWGPVLRIPSVPAPLLTQLEKPRKLPPSTYPGCTSRPAISAALGSSPRSPSDEPVA